MPYFVYLIRSLEDERQKYVGITTDLDQRLKEHNSGQSKHTSKYLPWECVVSMNFNDKYKAYEFEKYLKSHSGRAFASKRFW